MRYSRAFTLLELLIVLLIIGILIAMGLYKYQSVIEASYNKDAQVALRAGMINAEAVRAKAGTDTYPAVMANSDGLNYTAWITPTAIPGSFDDTSPKNILVALQPANYTMIALCNKSKSGKYYCLGTSSHELTLFVSSGSFTSSSSNIDLPTAYCALATVGKNLPYGCGGTIGDNTDNDGDGVRNMDDADNPGTTNQHPGGENDWFGGNGNGSSNPVVNIPKPGDQQVTGDIYFMDSGSSFASIGADGNDYTPITSGSSPVVSPNQETIAYGKSGGIYLRTGGVSTNTTLAGVNAGAYAFSADSTKLVAASGTTIYIVKISDNTITSFTLSGLSFPRGIQFSPDGTQLVMHGEAGGYSDLWKVDTDGTDLIKLTNSALMPGTNSRSPVWLSNLIVFANGNSPNGSQLYTIKPDGTNLTALPLTGIGKNNGASWQYVINRSESTVYAITDGKDIKSASLDGTGGATLIRANYTTGVLAWRMGLSYDGATIGTLCSVPVAPFGEYDYTTSPCAIPVAGGSPTILYTPPNELSSGSFGWNGLAPSA